MIRSDSLKEMNEYTICMEVPFWKENIKDRVKLLEFNFLNCCLKMTTANLRKIDCKMRD